MPEVAPENGVEISRVRVQVPPFWPEKPELWFCQLEGQFNLNGITQDNTKFWYVISQLDNKFAQEVEDIIVSPPPTDKYVKIKEELIRRLSSSQQQKTKRLLEHEEMGDRTPSQFLRHLKNLAGSAVPDDFLRSIWLNRLPSYMQAILATQADVGLDKTAELADKVNEAQPRTHVSSAGASSSNEIEALTKKIDLLTKQVAELSKHRPRQRYRSKSRIRTRQPGNQDTSGMCWYHTKFGREARKCRQPCSFPSGNESGRP